MHWCVYLTIYNGNLLPPFYIGSTSLERLRKGYHGSVCSKRHTPNWKHEIKHNKHLFQTKILKIFDTRREALEYERFIQIKLKVCGNPLYMNLSTAFGPKDHPWNKGTKGLQKAWNKGTKGLQEGWNKGLPNPKQKQRFISNNPMKNPKIVEKQRKTIFGNRPYYFIWICKYCGKTEEKINTVKHNDKSFCNRSCSTTYMNLNFHHSKRDKMIPPQE